MDSISPGGSLQERPDSGDAPEPRRHRLALPSAKGMREARLDRARGRALGHQGTAEIKRMGVSQGAVLRPRLFLIYTKLLRV